MITIKHEMDCIRQWPEAYRACAFNPKVLQVELARFFECESYQVEVLKAWMQAEEQYGTPSLDWVLKFEGTHAARFLTSSLLASKASVFGLYTSAVGYYIDIPWLMPDENEGALFAEEYASIRQEVEKRLEQLDLYVRVADLDRMCAGSRNSSLSNALDRTISRQHEAVQMLRILYEEILMIVAFFEKVEAHRTHVLSRKSDV